ncbi:two-component response regulator 24-like [Aristolochia californica]|uniref:two-component response regulator 24-like n=1 Tax=Aristolochia californica TaxID=171875 RepID=UPI0035DB5685
MPWSFGSSSSKKQKKVVTTTFSGPKSAGNGNDGDSKLPVNLNNDVNVLVVEDNRVNRKVLMRMLSWAGVRTQEVVNGKEAVDLHTAGFHFDLIFIDMEMPVMDGPQATRILRSMGVCTRIVGVSGNCRDSDRSEFLTAGIDEFYVKPLSREKLVEILHQVDDDISNN